MVMESFSIVMMPDGKEAHDGDHTDYSLGTLTRVENGFVKAKGSHPAHGYLFSVMGVCMLGLRPWFLPSIQEATLSSLPHEPSHFASLKHTRRDKERKCQPDGRRSPL